MGEQPPHEIEAKLNDETGGESQYLTFAVSGESYAVNVVVINEIVEVGQMTDVPLAPDFIRGVVSLRGAALPVVDLSIRLGHQQNEITSKSCIVVVEVDGMGRQVMGMLVDEVKEIMDIAPDMIQPAPTLGDQVRNDFIKGMGRVGENFIVLLDTECILSDEECQTIEHITYASHQDHD